MSHSDFLFKTSSFVDGAARAVDIVGDFDTYNYSASSREADVKALLHDIAAIRKDMWDAYESAMRDEEERVPSVG